VLKFSLAKTPASTTKPGLRKLACPQHNDLRSATPGVVIGAGITYIFSKAVSSIFKLIVNSIFNKNALLPFEEKMPDLKEAASADYSSESTTSQEFNGALYEVNGDLYGYDGNFLYEFIIPENNNHSPSKLSELPYEKPKRPSYEQLQKPSLYDIPSPQPTDQALQPEVSKLQGNMDK